MLRGRDVFVEAVCVMYTPSHLNCMVLKVCFGGGAWLFFVVVFFLFGLTKYSLRVSPVVFPVPSI